MTHASTAIACKLTEPDLRSRKEMLRTKLLPFLIQESFTAGTSRLVFSKPNVTKMMLEEMISLESECCPFFNFGLSETSSHFQVSITGPEGSEDMVRDFFAKSDDKACGCTGAPKVPSSKKKYVFGFISLCAIGCAIPPTLATFGLIGVATGAYIGRWVEVAVVSIIVIGGGYLLVQYVKKRQRKVSS